MSKNFLCALNDLFVKVITTVHAVLRFIPIRIWPGRRHGVEFTLVPGIIPDKNVVRRSFLDKFALYLYALRRAGLRLTEQRRAICAWLAETGTHPTPYQVFDEMAVTHPEISRATVYNTLNTLQQLGVIVEVGVGAEHTHYDTNPEPHINLICLRCHRVEDCEDAARVSELVARASAAAGFAPRTSRVDILGVCRHCQAADVSESIQVHPQHTIP